MEIKNLTKAVRRIKKAINHKENIILYGDADLDGVTSVIILQDAIKTLGGQVLAVYFPDREVEGYGISQKGLQYLSQLITNKKKPRALLIALDCGISNFKEVDLANQLGFEVMIVDHHQILNNQLPAAQIIVNPKQRGDRYPFKDFACVGVVFKLAEALLNKQLSEELRKSFLELTALATIADMMPQEGENKIFIEEGLNYLENSWRPGIKALLNTAELNSDNEIRKKVSKIISLLNVRDVKDNYPASYRLLNASSIEQAKEIILNLLVKHQIRKEKIEEITKEIKKRISQKDEPIIFEGDESFDLVLLSSVASNLCQEYQKPVFLYKKMEKESHGTIRTPKGIDSIALMKNCASYLLSYGGHPQASGFRLKNENLEFFKNCLLKQYEKNHYLH